MKRIFLIISLTTILAILVTTNLIIQNKMNMTLIHKMELEDKAHGITNKADLSNAQPAKVKEDTKELEDKRL